MDEDKSSEISRREFVKNISRWFGWGGLAVFLIVMGIVAVKFFIPNVLYEPTKIGNAGKPENYPIGVSERLKDRYRIFIVRAETGFYAMDAHCTSGAGPFG